MAPSTIYPVEITPEEEVLGFRLTDIEHPEARYGNTDRVPAVVYPFRKSYRLLKRWHPFNPNRHYYNLEVFGVFHLMPTRKPEWFPIKPPGHPNHYLNGGEATLIVEALPRWIDQGNGKEYLPRDPEAKNS
jgi:hypothetical protein